MDNSTSAEEWTKKLESTLKRLQSVKSSANSIEEALVVQDSRLREIKKEQEKIKSKFITGVTNKVYHNFVRILCTMQNISCISDAKAT